MSQRQSVPLGELRHGSQGQIDAVKELEQLFCLDKSTLLKVVDSFQRELVAGLADDRSSDLNMIPTYVTGKGNYCQKHRITCTKLNKQQVTQQVMKKAPTWHWKLLAWIFMLVK